MYDQKINELGESLRMELRHGHGMPVYMGTLMIEEAARGTITLYISGAVIYPGVYSLEEGSRIYDLIAMAGGPHPYADLEMFNLAALLEDARHVRVPFIGEEDISSAVPIFADTNGRLIDGLNSGATSSSYAGPVNINTASLSGLMTLPGIGEVVAGNIINYRNTHGPFETLEELMNVGRIGQATFNNIRHLITY